MRVFISWSGTLSQMLGEALRTWLPSALQMVRPYFTPADIEKGARWSGEIAKELEAAQVGIFCITRDNLNSPWMLFEAGAISKRLDKAHVCPILFGVENTELPGPLREFQTTPFNEVEMRKLFATINGALGENRLVESTAESVFDMWWPKLQADVNTILKEHEKAAATPKRKDRELLEEILELCDLTSRRVQTVGTIPARPMRDLLCGFIATHNDLAARADHSEVMAHLRRMRRAIQYLLERAQRGDEREELKEVMEAFNELSFRCERPPKSIEEDIPLLQVNEMALMSECFIIASHILLSFR